MKPIDIAGQVFGKLSVVRLVETGRHRKWACLCACGNEAIVSTSNLRSGNSKACGRCRGPNKSAQKHGGRPKAGKSATYQSWSSMKTRCLNQKSDHYDKYGAAGIEIDPRWLSYENFLEDMGERPAGKTLDRIDGSKGYYKDNCRWATHKEQTMNRCVSRSFSYKGENMSVMEFSKKYGLTYSAAYKRLARGRSLEATS